MAGTSQDRSSRTGTVACRCPSFGAVWLANAPAFFALGGRKFSWSCLRAIAPEGEVMSFAARVSRIAVVAFLAAAVAVSFGGLSGPESASAATSAQTTNQRGRIVRIHRRLP